MLQMTKTPKCRRFKWPTNISPNYCILLSYYFFYAVRKKKIIFRYHVAKRECGKKNTTDEKKKFLPINVVSHSIAEIYPYIRWSYSLVCISTLSFEPSGQFFARAKPTYALLQDKGVHSYLSGKRLSSKDNSPP